MVRGAGEREERVNAFEVDQRYLFRHYFEGQAVFDRLKRYYENQQYRFVVPPADFEPVRAFLADHGYVLVPVDETAPFAVVVRKYTAHPDNVFKAAVAQRSADGYNCFLLRDRDAVERAVAAGATPLVETDLEDPF